MAMHVPSELTHVIDQLRRIDEQSIHEGVSTQFLEFELSTAHNELRINGNPGGLVQFARAILQVVARGHDGAHQHFDEAGIVDRCDIPIVVCLKPAPWDNGSDGTT